jgi:hypothetical protein
MEMRELNSPIRYIYCLVDHENKRFKLGSTQHAHYARSLGAAYCPFDSFQAGFVEEYALIGERVLREQHAAEILTVQGCEQTNDGVWMHMSAFEVVRATLCHAQHVVPPTVLGLTSDAAVEAMLMNQLEKQRLELCAKLDKLLGLE